MTSSAHKLFLQALDLDAGERDDFIAEACGDDTELRLEIQRLLVDAERADSFFGDTEGVTIGAGGLEETYTETEGDVVGPYTLRQQIGEGGFGVVWMAEQSEPIQRMVALKVVKAGMDTKQVLARFGAERQALALMDHPNIAKVLDAGATSSGRPYFAMELVRGIPITEFCDQQKFGPKRRLELFKDVCSAVNHAHQKGIIHRDLKPSNVMVTLIADKPVVKVIDFGIAKATQNKLTDKTLFTRFEQFLGTPVYMSPEQASVTGVDVDTRSDIYSLGVLLYELLVGAPPFDQRSLLSAGYDEMRRIICEDEPQKPSTKLTETQSLSKATYRSNDRICSQALRGELDWIVMKAIEKDRVRRYETANAFASDIVRYLSNEPVLAAAPSAAYRFRKFARRNRVTLAVGVTMLLLLVGGIASTSWQAMKAKAEAKRAQSAEILAERRREESDLARQRAEAARDDERSARNEAEENGAFFLEMLESARPGSDAGGIVKVNEILDRAAEKLAGREHLSPGQRARLQASLGRTYHALGQYEKAIKHRTAVLDHYRKVSGSVHAHTHESLNELLESYKAAGLWLDELPLREEVLEISRKLYGPKDIKTIAAMNVLANSCHGTGHREKALKLREKALALSREVFGSESRSTIVGLTNTSASYLSAGRDEEALALREECVEVSRKYYGPKHQGMIMALGNLASSYRQAGREVDAARIRRELLEVHRQLVLDRRRELGRTRPETIEAMESLAKALAVDGQREQSLITHQEVFELRRDVLGPSHVDTLEAMTNVATALGRLGRKEDCLKLREDIVRKSRQALGPRHPVLYRSLFALARSYEVNDRAHEALKLREEGLTLQSENLGPDHPNTKRSRHELNSRRKALSQADED